MAGTQAVPGTVVPTGAQIGPAGGYGAQGATGPTGPAGSAPIADQTQPGLMNKLSGNTTDYVGGDNACHALPPIPPRIGGYLAYVSTTQLSFLPFNGAGIQINGVIYTIPNSGVVGLANTNVFVNGVAGQNLAASTVYLVYCFNNGGVLTADFSTTTHATSTTAGNVGVEIKSGDDTRTLLGIVLTGGTPIFYDQNQYRYTRSWVNRKRITFSNTSNGGTTASTTYFTVLNVTFVCFADDALEMHTSGYASISAVTSGFVRTTLDGSQMGMQSAFYVPTATASCSFGLSYAVQMGSEVQHTVSSQVYVQTGTMTYYVNLTGSIG